MGQMNEGKDCLYVEWSDGKKEKGNAKFIRTTRKVMEEIGFVPFDMTIS